MPTPPDNTRLELMLGTLREDHGTPPSLSDEFLAGVGAARRRTLVRRAILSSAAVLVLALPALLVLSSPGQPDTHQSPAPSLADSTMPTPTQALRAARPGGSVSLASFRPLFAPGTDTSPQSGLADFFDHPPAAADTQAETPVLRLGDRDALLSDRANGDS